jgi:cytochrome b
MAFVLLFISGQFNYLNFHIFFGHIIGAFVLTRLLLGFVSNNTSLKWSRYLYHPKELLKHLKKILVEKDSDLEIHNPAGSYLVLLMLFFLVVTVFTGALLESLFEFSGVMLFLNDLINTEFAYLILNLHQYSSNAMMFLVITHIFGVLYSSYLSRKNFLLTMITGKL